MIPRAIVSGEPSPVSSDSFTSACCESGSINEAWIERVRDGLFPSIAQSSGPDVEASCGEPSGPKTAAAVGAIAPAMRVGCTAATAEDGGKVLGRGRKAIYVSATTPTTIAKTNQPV